MASNAHSDRKLHDSRYGAADLGPTLSLWSLLIALSFAVACWLLDTALAVLLADARFVDALLPEGNALALRVAVASLVAVAAAITSTSVVRELRLFKPRVEPEPDTSSDLLENFDGCAFAINEKGEILDANQAAARLFSWPVNMFMPMTLDWLFSDVIDGPDGRHRRLTEIIAASEDIAAKGPLMAIGKALSGQKFVAEITFMPARNETHRYVVFVRERDDTRQSRRRNRRRIS